MLRKSLRYSFLALGMVWFAFCSCKKSEGTGEGSNPPSTPISADLEGLWVDYSSAYFGHVEVQIWYDDQKKWKWEVLNLVDPWELNPDVAAMGVQFGNVNGQGKFIEVLNENAGTTQYNIGYRFGNVVQEGNKLTLYPTVSKIATRSSSTHGTATLDGSKQKMVFTYTIETDDRSQNNVPRKKLILKAEDGNTYTLYNGS